MGSIPSKQSGEFLKLFKTHDLEILLQLSGVAKKILTQFSGWSILVDWNPEKRYSSQKLTLEKTKLMIETSENFLLQL